MNWYKLNENGDLVVYPNVKDEAGNVTDKPPVEGATREAPADYITARLKQTRRGDILNELAALDMKLIRPLSENNAERVAAINAEKTKLRIELGAL